MTVAMTIFEPTKILLVKGFIKALENARKKPSGVVLSLTVMTLFFS